MIALSTCLGLWVTLQLVGVDAHIAMWNKGLFGFNWPDLSTSSKQNYNNNHPIVPSRANDNLPISKWFGRGLQAFPPAPGDFMELEAGGVFTGELSCNRAWTSFRSPNMDGQPYHYYACPGEGPLHTKNKFGEEPDPQYFGGTAIAIAYTSDIDALKPDDLTIISVNYTSVWTRLTDYRIPCGLPKCPEGGCLCSWNWIHQAANHEGYGAEIYNNLYRCMVTGQTSDTNVLPLGGGTVPVPCESDPALCIKGPKKPMYLYQAEGNNMPEPPQPPNYNYRYGFADGAQLDIFNDVSKTLCPDSSKIEIGQPGEAVPVDVAEAEGEHPAEATPIAQPDEKVQAAFAAKAVPGAGDAATHASNEEEVPRSEEKIQEDKTSASESNISEYEILFNPFMTGNEAQQAFLAVPVPTMLGDERSSHDEAARRGF